MTAELILVRHAPVSDRYHGRCYGRSDVELSPQGERLSVELSTELATRPIRRVIHSGLQRTRYLAELLAERLSLAAECCESLQERNYGSWELEHWDSVYERFGDEMMRVVSDPEIYRPGGGETTFEMRDRVLNWFHTLTGDETIVAVTHGGPIAALRGAQQALPVSAWLDLIPACGEYVSLAVDSTAWSGFRRVVWEGEAPAEP